MPVEKGNRTPGIIAPALRVFERFPDKNLRDACLSDLRIRSWFGVC